MASPQQSLQDASHFHDALKSEGYPLNAFFLNRTPLPLTSPKGDTPWYKWIAAHHLPFVEKHQKQRNELSQLAKVISIPEQDIPPNNIQGISTLAQYLEL